MPPCKWIKNSMRARCWRLRPTDCSTTLLVSQADRRRRRRRKRSHQAAPSAQLEILYAQFSRPGFGSGDAIVRRARIRSAVYTFMTICIKYIHISIYIYIWISVCMCWCQLFPWAVLNKSWAEALLLLMLLDCILEFTKPAEALTQTERDKLWLGAKLLLTMCVRFSWGNHKRLVNQTDDSFATGLPYRTVNWHQGPMHKARLASLNTHTNTQHTHTHTTQPLLNGNDGQC